MLILQIQTDSISHVMNPPAGSSLSCIADWLTIIGLLVSILGFVYTVAQVNKTKKAAVAAKDSAQQTSQKIESLQVIASLSKNIEILKACPKLLMDSHWLEVANHLTDARDQLIVIIEGETDPSSAASLKKLKNELNVDIRNLYSRANDESFELLIDTLFDRITEVQEIFVTKQTKIKKV